MGFVFFRKEKMFEKVGLFDMGYEIMDYLFVIMSVDSLLFCNDVKDVWS